MRRKRYIHINEQDSAIKVEVPESLTEKELTVFRKLLQGKSVTKIALELRRSPKTISTQKKRLYIKMGIRNDVTLWLDLLLVNKVLVTTKKHVTPLPASEDFVTSIWRPSSD